MYLELNKGALNWYGVPVRVRADMPHDEIILPYFNEDPDQLPSFTVTQVMFNVVTHNAAEYMPIVKRLLEEWWQNKQSFLTGLANGCIPMKPLADDTEWLADCDSAALVQDVATLQELLPAVSCSVVPRLAMPPGTPC
jgi:hypothetical protein